MNKKDEKTSKFIHSFSDKNFLTKLLKNKIGNLLKRTLKNKSINKLSSKVARKKNYICCYKYDSIKPQFLKEISKNKFQQELNNTIEENSKINLISLKNLKRKVCLMDLANECLTLIFTHLKASDVSRVANVCQRLRLICQQHRTYLPMSNIELLQINYGKWRDILKCRLNYRKFLLNFEKNKSF